MPEFTIWMRSTRWQVLSALKARTVVPLNNFETELYAHAREAGRESFDYSHAPTTQKGFNRV